MDVEYSLTVEDMEAFTRYLWQQGRMGGSPRAAMMKVVRGIALALLVGLILVVQSVLFASDERSMRVAYFGFGFVVGVLILLLPGLGVGKAALRSVRRVYESKNTRWLLAHRRLTIGPGGVTVTSEIHRLDYSWSVIWSIETTDDYAYMFITQNSAHVVPRDAFPDRRQFEAFVDQARRYRQDWYRRSPESDGILDALPATSDAITRPKKP